MRDSAGAHYYMLEDWLEAEAELELYRLC